MKIAFEDAIRKSPGVLQGRDELEEKAVPSTAAQYILR